MLSFLQNLFFGAQPAHAKALTPQEAIEFIKENPDVFLLDVRTEKEFSEQHYKNARLIPISELEARKNEIPTDKDVLIYCRSGNRAKSAARILGGEDKEHIYFIDGFPDYSQFSE